MFKDKFFVICVVLTVVMLFAGTSRAMNYCEYESDPLTAALWHMNDGSGTVVTDSGPGGFDGTLMGTNPPTWSTGLFNGGLQFNMYYNTSTLDGSCGVQFDDDSTDGLIYPGNGVCNSGSWTLEMYLKWDYASSGPIPGDTGFIGYIASDSQNNNSNMYVRSYIDDINPLNWHCALSFGLQAYGTCCDPNSPVCWYVLSTDDTGYSLAADEWTHVAFAFEWTAYYHPTSNYGTEAVQWLYVDGVEVAFMNYGMCGVGLWGGDFHLGEPNSGGTCSWGGEMDEVRVSDPIRDPNLFGCPECWGYLDGDINADCNVMFIDFAEMAADWAMCTPGLAGDIVDMGDDCVDLYDLTKYAKDWLKCSTVGDPECLDCLSVAEFTESGLEPNTLALWHMNEGSGAVAYDATGNYDLTINAGSWPDVTWTSSGRFGNGLNFPTNGEGWCQSADMGICSSETDPPVFELTVEQWINADAGVTHTQYLAGLSGASVARIQEYGSIKDNRLCVTFYTFIRGGYWPAVYVTPYGKQGHIGGTGWHHLAGVYDGRIDDNNNIHVYLYWDGVLADTTVWRANTAGVDEQLVYTVGDGTVTIGNSLFSSNFNGVIDEVRLTTKALHKFFDSPCD